MVDAEEDARLVGAVDDSAESGDLLLRRLDDTWLPEARDPDGAEAGVVKLVQGGRVVPDAVVYCSNQ